LKKPLSELTDYIIKFLLHGNEHLADRVGYTTDVSEYHKYSVIITPSGFFDRADYGKPSTIPSLPLPKLGSTEILFGSPQVKRIDNKIIVEADIIASSFFLLSRYEEFVRTDAIDMHGRADGRQMLQYRAGFIDRPIVDEYSDMLLSWLQATGHIVSLPSEGFGRIFLTHDIDSIGLYQDWRGVLRGLYNAIVKRNISLKTVLHSIVDEKSDPAYTFDWLIEEDRRVPYAEIVFFVKALHHSLGYDRPHYNINSRKLQKILSLLHSKQCTIGLHSSYGAFSSPSEIKREHTALCRSSEQSVRYQRSHYLTILPPDAPHHYVEAGITDDFTLGFAAVAGFRLGTCRPVRWINPATLAIEPITLHPLTIMEGSLSNSNYMNLSYEQALEYSRKLIEEVRRHRGELVLLWHNTSVCRYQNGYQRTLYSDLIRFLTPING